MKHNKISFNIRNNLTELNSVSKQIEEFTQLQGLSKKTILEITLCIEEHVTNIITHGYQDSEEHWIGITLSRAGEKFFVSIEDDGIPYNPTEAAAPDLESTLEERKIGGLGVHLIKHYMDDMVYQRYGKRNVFVMTKNI
jgi:serine/threonine-protein kinase RsbW